MKKLYLPSAAVALFTTAALVACHGTGGGYNPAISQGNPQESAAHEGGPLAIPPCKAPKRGAGTWLTFFAAGHVKGTTFTAFTGKSAESAWILDKWAKGPTPSPSPSPSASPTPKPYEIYLYYGTFTTKNKQAGCAYLEATTKGENFPYVNYNGLAEGFPNIIPGNYKITLVTSGLVKSLVVANLSTKGGSGTVNLTTILGKPYTTGTITLVGRVVIKVPDEAQRLMKAVLDQGS